MVKSMNIAKESILKEFVNALVYHDSEAEILYQQSINNTDGRGVQNGKFHTEWSRRYNAIFKIAEANGLEPIKINRTLWEAVVVQDDKGIIYMFFKEKNLKKIIKKGKETHYAKLLIRSVNGLLNELQNDPIQQSLPLSESLSDDQESDEFLQKCAQQILDQFNKEPSKVIIITFDSVYQRDIAHGYVFNSDYEVVWQRNLSYLIDPDYNFDLKQDNITPEKREGSTKTKIKTKEKRIVRLKQT